MARAGFVVVLAACGGGAGGGDGVCGPDIATDVMTATDSDDTVSLTFDNFTASASGSCPDPAAPEGTVSLVIRGSHDSGGQFVICIPRPDRLEATGSVGGGELEVNATDATADGCTFEKSPDAGGFGGAEVGGFCDGGTNPAGFRLSTSLQTSVRRTCGGTATTVMLLFTGSVEVVPR